MPLIEASHDSLPYIDPDLTPATRAHITALIAAELPPTCKTTPHPSLPPLPSPTFTPLIESELARHAAHLPLTGGIDTTRYEALTAPPTTSTPPSSSDLAAWRTTLTQAYASSSHLDARLTNLALLERFGKNAWLVGNAQLEGVLGGLEREVVEVRGTVEEVNRARKELQEGVRGEVGALEEAWREGVGRVLRVEVAAEGLRREVLERRRVRGG